MDDVLSAVPLGGFGIGTGTGDGGGDAVVVSLDGDGSSGGGGRGTITNDVHQPTHGVTEFDEVLIQRQTTTTQ